MPPVPDRSAPLHAAPCHPGGKYLPGCRRPPAALLHDRRQGEAPLLRRVHDCGFGELEFSQQDRRSFMVAPAQSHVVPT